MNIKVICSPRSELFHLQPEGLGSTMVESMSSYVNRLAEEHRVSVRDLIGNVISKKLPSAYCRPNMMSGNSYTSVGAHNGTGELAEQWLEALTQLTLHKELKSLSLLSYRNILTENYLLRTYKAWCPRCLEEMRERSCIYEPLLWQVEAVTVCPLHHQRLETACPNCRRKPDHLAARSRNGHCSRFSCSQWLGNCADLTLDEYEIRQELYFATEVGNLLAMTPSLGFMPGREFISWYIDILINEHARGNISGFSTLIRLPRESVSDWKNGNHRPRLPQLLSMSFFFNDSVSARLREWQLLSAGQGGSPDGESPQPPRRPARTSLEGLSEKSRKAEGILRSIIQGDLPPIPIKEIAKECDCHLSLLYLHFSGLCRQVTEISRKWSKQFVELRNDYYMNSLRADPLSQRMAMQSLCISSKRFIGELFAKMRSEGG